MLDQMDLALVDCTIYEVEIGPDPNRMISNNSSFRPKHPGVPNGSDGSDRTTYPLTENYTLPVAHRMGRVA